MTKINNENVIASFFIKKVWQSHKLKPNNSSQTK